MEVRDWALVLFTILGQLGVGSFIVMGIVHFFAARKEGVEEADRMSDRALLAIGPLLVLGTLASLFHLGDPVNAYKAATNFSSSWLSREIVFNVLFIVAGGIFAGMQWRKIATPAIRNAVAWVAAIIGLALVYSMAQIYMLRTVPAWDTIATPISFFVTTFLLGSLAVGTAYVVNYSYMQRRDESGCEEGGVQCSLVRGALRGIAIAAIVLVGIEFVVQPLYLADLSADTGAAQESARVIIEDYGVVFALRLLFVFIGAALLGGFLYWNASSPGKLQVAGNVAYAAFALVLIAEVLGRFVFYASKVGVGIFT
jgi:anaerobic dimethyl sulfoxide reductase subunit C